MKHLRPHFRFIQLPGVLLLALIACSSTMLGQSLDPANANWDVYSLPEEIHEIMESPDQQTIYLATAFGLYGIDRNSKAVARWDRQNGLPSHRIDAMAFDSEERLWIGTYDMSLAVRETDDSWRSVPIPSSLVSESPLLYDMAIRADGVWIASSAGLLHFDQDTEIWSRKTSSTSAISAPLETYALIDDGSGGWYVAADNLYRFDPSAEAWENLSQNPYAGTASGVWSGGQADLLQGPEGLWYASSFGWLGLFDGNGWQDFTSGGACTGGQTSFMAHDNLGTTWLLAPGVGLFRYDGSDWVLDTIDHPEFTDPQFTAFHIDSDGKRWLAAGHRFMQQVGTAFEEADLTFAGIKGPSIRKVISDAEGRTWLLDGYGIHSQIRYQATLDAAWTPWPGDPGSVKDISIDGQGGLWLLDLDNTASHLDAAGNLLETVEKPAITSNFWMLRGDANGGFWVRGTNGLYRYNDATWHRYDMTTSDPLPADDIHTLVADPRGGCWVYQIGATGAQHYLSYFNGSGWLTYTESDGLPHAFINDMAIAADGSVWLGTWGAGLVKIDGFDFTTWTPDNSSIPFYIIKSLEHDKDGRIWLGSLQDGLAVSDSGDPTSTWTVFNESNAPLLDKTITTLAVYPDGSMGVAGQSKSWQVLRSGTGTGVGVVSSEVTSTLTAFPVPTTSLVSLRWKTGQSAPFSGAVSWTLFDGQGRSVRQGRVMPSGPVWQLSMAGLTPGVYHCLVRDGQQEASIRLVLAAEGR